MCDYSLHHVASRPAKVSDKLVTMELTKSSARGFAAVGELGAKLVIHDRPPNVAVCLLPGTELAFNDDVQYERAFGLKARIKHKVARFREIEMNDPPVHYDALEFPDGQVLKLSRLTAGQSATVLQLPVTTQHHHPVEPRHVARSAESRVALNRVSPSQGMASVFVPNQGAVMLWQTLRSTAISLSTSFVQAFRRVKAQPAAIDAEKIEARLPDLLAATLANKPEVLKPERKPEVTAAA